MKLNCEKYMSYRYYDEKGEFKDEDTWFIIDTEIEVFIGETPKLKKLPNTCEKSELFIIPFEDTEIRLYLKKATLKKCRKCGNWSDEMGENEDVCYMCVED